MAIAGEILLVIVVVILLLLCIPVRLILRYRTGKPALGQLRWLFFKLDLLKAANKNDEKKRSKDKMAKQKPDKEKKPLEFTQLLGIVVDLISSLKGGARMLVRNFWLYKVRLIMTVAGEDAADIAVDYGKCNAAVYSAYAIAKIYLNMANPQIDIRPDFVSGKSLIDFEIRGRLTPIIVLGAGIRIFSVFLVKTIQRKNHKEKEPTGRNSYGQRVSSD